MSEGKTLRERIESDDRFSIIWGNPVVVVSLFHPRRFELPPSVLEEHFQPLYLEWLRVEPNADGSIGGWTALYGVVRLVERRKTSLSLVTE